MSVCLAADGADVRPIVGVTVHVALKVMLEFEATAAGGTAVGRSASYEHSRMGAPSEVEGYWGWLRWTVQCFCCGRGGELMTKYELLFLAIWRNSRQTNQLGNCLHHQHGLGSNAAVFF